jgi:tryptophan-rich sensory protein
MHPPPAVFVLLFALMLLSALLAGYAMAAAKTRNWLHRVTFALTLAGAAYVILDLEYPRFGLIRVDAFDQALVDLRQSMR